MEPVSVLYCGYEGRARESTLPRKNLYSDFPAHPAEETRVACGQAGLHIADMTAQPAELQSVSHSALTDW